MEKVLLGRWSLRSLLVVGAVLLGVIPVLVLGIGLARAVRSNIITDAMERDEVFAAGLASQYEQFLALHSQALAAVAAQASTLDALKPTSLTPILARTLVHYPTITGLAAAEPSGKGFSVILSTGGETMVTPGLDYSDRAWFKEVVQSRRPFMDKAVIVGKATKAPLVSISAPVLDAVGNLRAVVSAGLDLEDLGKVAARIAHGKTGYAVVTTAQGQPLFHPRNQYVREQRDFSRLPIWSVVASKKSGQLPSYVGAAEEERLGGFATVAGIGWKIWVGEARSEVDGEVADVYWRLLGWVALGLLAPVGLVAMLAVTISRPIQAVQAAASAFAEGNLNQEAQEQGPREVAALARAFNHMAGALRQMVGAEREGKARLERAVAEYGAVAARVAGGDLAARAATDSGPELAALGENLNRMIEALGQQISQIRRAAGDISTAASEILVSTSQQAAGAAEAATAIQETSTTVDEVKQTAQVTAQKAKAVVDAAQKTAQVSRTGRQAVEESVQGVQEAKARMETLAERILALSEQAQTIGEIITSVNDLAEQSNLLAVNAAIEAAKAGEAGKGFAVVAAEVKALAEQSKQATAQVRGILQEIQRATQAAVMAAEQGVKTAAAGEGVARQAGEAIRQLTDGLTESAQLAQQILASAQQQVAGMDQVALAMRNIQQASTQNIAATRQVEKAGQDLTALAGRLTAIIPGGNERGAGRG